MACYATLNDVEALTGPLAAGQAAHALAVLEAATEWMEQAIGRGWDQHETAWNESFVVDGRAISLARWPVLEVAAVTVRDRAGTVTTLAEAEYTLDASRGLLWLRWHWPTGSWADVTYTPRPGIPARVRMAVAQLAAHWLEPVLNPGMANVEQYTLPDLSVRFARGSAGQVVPPTVLALAQQLREVYAR
jgi:hypothetical protein